MNGYFIIAAFIVGLLIGWHGHTIWDGYRDDKVAVAEEAKTQVAEQKIVTFNQAFNKDTQHAKDNCLSKPLPANLRKLLQ